jgi:hypothetical protein
MKSPRISTDKLRKAIIAAEASRTQQMDLLRPTSELDSKLRGIRRAHAKEVSDLLVKTGLDTQKLQTLQRQLTQEQERLLTRRKAAALKLAAAKGNAFQSTFVEQSSKFRDLAALDEFSPNPSFTIDKPFLIWTSPLMDLVDSGISAFSSFAKFQIESSAERDARKVGFYFLWVNPFDDFAVIHATTFLSATGFVSAHAPWAFWSDSRIDVEARLAMWAGTAPELSSTDYTSEFLGRAGAIGTWSTGSGTDSMFVVGRSNMSKTAFVVAPRQLAIIEVALAVESENDDGNVVADFATGNFGLVCPLVVVSLVNSPGAASQA